MSEKHKVPAETEEKYLSALEKINASFAELKKEAEQGDKKLEPHRMEAQASDTMEKINASFAAVQQKAAKRDKKEDKEWLWNLAAGILTVLLILATVTFIVMIYRGSSQDGNDAEHTPAVQITETEETKTTERSSEDTEKESEKASEGTGTEKQTEAESGETAAAEAGRVIPEEYEAILNEKEKEEWKGRKTDSSRLFVQMNQKLNLDGDGNVYLRLINPPYSAFDIQIRVYIQDDPETVLFQSEVLEPGTILEYADFDSVPEPGEYAAGVEYTVYDKKGNKIGTHEVSVELSTQGQQGAAGE